MAFVLIAASGCPRSAESDAGDAPAADIALLEDVAIDTRRPDRDGDGLCDDTERFYRTDPARVDSDGDGLTDLFEVRAYTSPLSATDPPATERVSLRERPGARVTISYGLLWRGEGDVLTGVLLDRLAGVDERVPSEFGPSIVAADAEPRASVANIVGPSFEGVVGRVRLRWEISLEWPSVAPIGCRRAYLMSAAVFLSGRGLVYALPVAIDVHGDADGAGMDAGMAGDAGDRGTPAGPRWPYVSTEGYCLPPPGECQ